jgi:predicted RNA-binding protein with PIN domain
MMAATDTLLVSSFKFQVSSQNTEQSRRPKAAARADFGLWSLDLNDYASPMALVRILVDGYSLLHNWPELAEGAARHSEAARTALAEMLTHYQDACGTPITIFFDGNLARYTKPKNESSGAVEIIFSRAGQTADDLIERAAHRFQAYGEVLVVTDDFAERDMVTGFGGSVASCANFIRMIDNALANLRENLKNHNRAERNRFSRSR